MPTVARSSGSSGRMELARRRLFPCLFFEPSAGNCCSMIKPYFVSGLQEGPPRLGLHAGPPYSATYRRTERRAIAETLPISREARRTRGQEIDELKLSELAGQKAYTLSGGERRDLRSPEPWSFPQVSSFDELFSEDPISVSEVTKIIFSLRKGESVFFLPITMSVKR